MYIMEKIIIKNGSDILIHKLYEEASSTTMVHASSGYWAFLVILVYLYSNYKCFADFQNRA